MGTKRLLGWTSLLVAGLALAGCQGTNRSPQWKPPTNTVPAPPPAGVKNMTPSGPGVVAPGLANLPTNGNTFNDPLPAKAGAGALTNAPSPNFTSAPPAPAPMPANLKATAPVNPVIPPPQSLNVPVSAPPVTPASPPVTEFKSISSHQGGKVGNMNMGGVVPAEPVNPVFAPAPAPVPPQPPISGSGLPPMGGAPANDVRVNPYPPPVPPPAPAPVGLPTPPAPPGLPGLPN